MPNVGGKKFGYGAKGMTAAKEETKKTGKPMTKKAGYMKGGMAAKKKMSKGGMAAKKKKQPPMSLYENMNKQKKSGKSRTKKNSTVSPKAYSDMKAGFPNSKKNKAKKKKAKA